MKLWGVLFLSILLLTGCTGEKRPKEERVFFSVLIPKPVAKQSTRYIEGVQVFTSETNNSAVSAMIVNNPIRADREALIALAIQNRTDKTIPLNWKKISFFHPKNIVKMLPIDEVCHYFNQPGHSKPILGSHVFREQLLKYGVIHDQKDSKKPLPTEKSLAQVYNDIKKDLCFVRLPHNTTLAPNTTTVGFLVILLPKENFLRQTHFMLKIPVANDLHKLRYTLQPID